MGGERGYVFSLLTEMIHYENAIISCKKCGRLYKFQAKIKNLILSIQKLCTMTSRDKPKTYFL